MINRQTRRAAQRKNYKTTSRIERMKSRLRQIEHDAARPQIRLTRFGY